MAQRKELFGEPGNTRSVPPYCFGGTDSASEASWAMRIFLVPFQPINLAVAKAFPSSAGRRESCKIFYKEAYRSSDAGVHPRKDGRLNSRPEMNEKTSRENGARRPLTGCKPHESS